MFGHFFGVYPLNHSPKNIGLICGRYLQFRFLKWPLNNMLKTSWFIFRENPLYQSDCLARKFGIPFYSPLFVSQYRPFLVLHANKVISYKTLAIHFIEKICLVLHSIAAIFSLKRFANAARYVRQGVIYLLKMVFFHSSMAISGT